MKNKKKLIISIVILLIVTSFCILGVLFNMKNKMKTREDVTNITNIIANSNKQLEDFSNIEIAEAVANEVIEEPKTDDNKQIETSQVNTSNSNDSKNKTSTVKQNQTQVNTSTQNQQAANQTPITTPSTQTPIQNTTVESEKYVKNDMMINKIKNVINNNQSDNMKTYGYTIQVDPSIKTKTNQFTFTESRVINFIKYAFGTIRVYAEDYYNNGQLIMTECYIL